MTPAGPSRVLGFDFDSEDAVSQTAEAKAQPVVAPRYGRRDYLIRRGLLAADGLGIATGLSAAALVGGRPDVAEFLLWGVLTLPAWAVLMQVYGLYHRDIKRVSHSAIDDLPWLFHVLIVGTLLLWGYFKVAVGEPLVLAEVVAFAGAALLAMLAFRALVRRLIKRRLGREPALLIGGDAVMTLLVRKLETHPEYGLNPVGRLAVSPAENGVVGLPVLGGLDHLEGVVKRHAIERLVVSHSGLEQEGLLTVLRHAKRLGLKVGVLPEMFDVMGPSVEIDDIEGVTLLGINPPVLSRSSRAMKRAMDVLGATILLVLFAPLLVAIGIAVKLDSPGPALFSQERVGRRGKGFQLLKFRTMVADAEMRRDELMAASQEESWLKIERDPRITRVGRLLRYASLDELPQLWNVLRGQMSLVGPRPLVEQEDRLIDGWGRTRLDLTPGVTGSWQVLGRTNIPFEEMVKLDYLYVTNWSLWTDARLILRTVPAVVTRRGAN